MRVAVLGAASALVACMSGNAQPRMSAADLVVERINTAVYVCERADGDAFEFTIRHGPDGIAVRGSRVSVTAAGEVFEGCGRALR